MTGVDSFEDWLSQYITYFVAKINRSIKNVREEKKRVEEIIHGIKGMDHKQNIYGVIENEDKIIGRFLDKINLITEAKNNNKMLRDGISRFGLNINTYNLIQKKVFCLLLTAGRYGCTKEINSDYNTLIKTNLNDYRHIEFLYPDKKNRFILHVGDVEMECVSNYILECILDAMNNRFFIIEKIDFVLCGWKEEYDANNDFVIFVVAYLFPKIELMDKTNMLEFLKSYYKDTTKLSEIKDTINYDSWEIEYSTRYESYVVRLYYVIGSVKSSSIPVEITKRFLTAFSVFIKLTYQL